MIIQHPLLWCAILFAAGIIIGEGMSVIVCLPILAAAVIGAYLLRHVRMWYELMTVVVWLALGCCRGAACAHTPEPAWPEHIRQQTAVLRDGYAERLGRAGVSRQTLALSQALVVGDRGGMDYTRRQAYAHAGASHLLALSGMHLGILFSLLYILIIRPLRATRWRWAALLPLLLTLWGYVLLTGMPVSLVRAAVMLSLCSVMLLQHYVTDPLHPLAVSAIAILFFSPEDIHSLSFQLSFSAVSFILLLSPQLNDYDLHLPRMTKLLAVSCIAQAGTLPLTLYHFHQLPLLAPLLSLILLPLTMVIVYLSLLTFALPFVLLGECLNAMVAMQERIIHLASVIPGATLTGIYPTLPVVILLYAALLLMFIRLSRLTL